MSLVETYKRRAHSLASIRSSPDVAVGAWEYYRERPIDFISDWIDTYDPRRVARGESATIPFVLFERQRDLAEFVMCCIREERNGMIEKSRDMGATWLCVGLSVWMWLFWEGVSIGWGSRKADLVDRIGDADSIFEKMRIAIMSLPVDFRPAGLKRDKHLTYMRITNPVNGSSITGESGDNIGRGGRKLVYFKDESAHYERPELIEAALSDNTNCQIDISSVSGLGTVFHRKRESGKNYKPGKKLAKDRTNVFIMDWRDHPDKDQEWYDNRRRANELSGMLHIFAQEVDRDYAAAVSNTLIKREWVLAAIDLHKTIPALEAGGYMGGLDIADEGTDTNAISIRKGLTLKYLDEWPEGDTGETTRRAITGLRDWTPIEAMYDSVGVGAGVKAETNRLEDEGSMPSGVTLIPWNGGGAVQDKDKSVNPYDKESPLNGDVYLNLKAQAWHSVRMRLEKAWRYRERGETFPVDELLSIDAGAIEPALLYQLEKELCQVQRSATSSMKERIDKAPDGVRSPNLADCVVMNFFPVVGMGAYGRYMLENIR